MPTLTGKEKAVVAFVITLITGAITIATPYISDNASLVQVVQIVSSAVAFLGTTFGVYQTTNSTPVVGDHSADGVATVDVTDTTPAA